MITFTRSRNKKETLSQNYRRLGLTAKLGKATGGMEARPSSRAVQDPLAVSQASSSRAAIRSVRVERDADGKITRVLHKSNPLNDPLADLDSDDNDEEEEEEEEPTANKAENGELRVVDLLEQEARAPTESHKRHQSSREREWIEALVARHGVDGVQAMARDMKLNPMQQTAGEIKRKLKVYLKESGN